MDVNRSVHGADQVVRGLFGAAGLVLSLGSAAALIYDQRTLAAAAAGVAIPLGLGFLRLSEP